jgi:predicted transposase YdaD
VIVTEFQGYDDRRIYYRAFAGAALLGEQEPEREIHILILFLDEKDDPKTPSWHQLGRSAFPAFNVVYLKEVVAQLRRQNQADPLAGLFELVLEPDPEKVREKASGNYHNIEVSGLPARTRRTYGKIYIYWLMQRLKNLTREEVHSMLGIMTPLKETRAYQDIAQEVLAEAETRFEKMTRAAEEARLKAENAAKEARLKAERELAQTLNEELNDWRQLLEGELTPAAERKANQAIARIEQKLAEIGEQGG